MQKTDKTFKEIIGRRISNTSLLNQFDILKDENGEYLFNIWKNYKITDDIKENEDNISMYDVPHESFWENIAYNLYENENLWWLIAMTNDVVNPFEELDTGDQIKILKEELIYQTIKQLKRISEL